MAVDLAQASDSKPLAQDSLALKQVFQTIQATSCPHTFNFHMHTVCSDGQLQPEELMEQAISIGLQGLAITDHHTTDGYQRAQQWLWDWQLHHPEQLIPHLWTGAEISANLLENEVHILAYAFDPQDEGLVPYLQKRSTIGEPYEAKQVISAIHQAGGLAVLAHPARYRRSPQELIPAAVELGIDGLETYYAYTNPHPWKPSPEQTQQVSALGTRYNLLNTCGTDTHGRSLLQRL
jgi:predicted metal-dependent phosphoesterase TrpH